MDSKKVQNIIVYPHFGLGFGHFWRLFFYHFGELAAFGRSRGPTYSSELHAWTHDQGHHHPAMVVVETGRKGRKGRKRGKRRGLARFFWGKNLDSSSWEQKKKKKKIERKLFSKGDREVSSRGGQAVFVSEELLSKLSVYFLFIFITTVIPSFPLAVRSFVCLFGHG